MALKLWSCGFSQLPSSQPKLVGFRNDWQYGETGDVALKEGECIEGVSELHTKVEIGFIDTVDGSEIQLTT